MYRSVEKGAAVITGAEQVKNWELVEGTMWCARIPNGIFGSYNPYTTLVSGDWFIAMYIATYRRGLSEWKIPVRGDES